MNELGKCGSRVYAPYRGDEMEMREVRQMFDHGQLGFIPFSPRDEDSIRESIRSSDVVINLIGKHYETKHVVPTRRANGRLSRVNYGYEEVNVTIPQTLARLAREAGVRSFIHVSASSANLDSLSEWNRTKAQGEIAVRQEFPDAILVKPNNIFGPEDRFLNMFGVAAQVMRCYPLLYDGKTTVQPVHVADVGRALMEIVWNRHDFAGADFHLAGPDEYNYKEIAELVEDITHVRRPMVSIPAQAALAVGAVSDFLINPMFTPDDVHKLADDNVVRLSDEEKLAKPKKFVTRVWTNEERMNKANMIQEANEKQFGPRKFEILTEEEARDMIMGENKGHRFTFEDLNIEPMSMDKTAFDFLRRFRIGGKYNVVAGYKK
jgi:NADH dehydrogenase (ubiquinone) 1 alpha subcomplex subunit 9